MTLTIRSCKNVVAPIFAALMLTAAAPGAHAIVVHIDSSRSSVTYTPGGIILCGPEGCGSLPEPQTFTLSGSFDVVRETISYPVWFDPSAVIEREEIWFDPLAVDSGGAAALGFSFPTYRGVMSGETFSGSDDLCSFLPSTGGCWSMPPISGFTGTFDGAALSMTGDDYAGRAFPDRFSFVVVAQAADAASVPEPGILACVVGAIFGLGVSVRRRTDVR